VRIRGEAPDDPERHISLAPTLREDWSFEGRVTAGLSWLLRVTTPAGWTMKSVRVRSRDITDQPVMLTADLNDVEIVLTDRVTTVSGTVFEAGGMAATSATVVIMVDDPQKWGPHSRFIRRVRTNASGRFTIQGLPAGRYIGVALQYLLAGDEGNPELLTRLRPLGQALMLDDAGSSAVTINVSPHP
jgi:hypothetical protein